MFDAGASIGSSNQAPTSEIIHPNGSALYSKRSNPGMSKSHDKYDKNQQLIRQIIEQQKNKILGNFNTANATKGVTKRNKIINKTEKQVEPKPKEQVIMSLKKVSSRQIN